MILDVSQVSGVLLQHVLTFLGFSVKFSIKIPHSSLLKCAVLTQVRRNVDPNVALEQNRLGAKAVAGQVLKQTLEPLEQMLYFFDIHT